MKKILNKTFSALMVLLLLFTQFSQIAVAFAQGSSDSNEEIEIIMEEGGTVEEATFRVSINEQVDEVNIEYPEGAHLHNEMESMPSNTYTDHKETNTLNIKNLEDIQEFKFSLKDLHEGENVLKSEVFQKENSLTVKDFTFEIPATKEQSQADTEKEEIDEVEDDNLTSEAEATNANLIAPLSGNLNVDIDISPQNSNVSSGNDAAYQLVFKTTGSVAEYTNAVINIELPDSEFAEFNQNLSELQIAGVEPSYDSENNLLSYAFDTLKTGQTYENIIKLETENGVTPNGTELAVSASFEAD
jgi:hypothetical protein